MIDLFGEVQKPASKSRKKQNPMLVLGKTENEKCKNCTHFRRFKQSKVWFKCQLRGTQGRGTDHKANWQACSRFEKVEN